eukprot:12448970-Alexandrium_andersonii.AAC.1
MSASLVGSEMCIRDRCEVVHAVPGCQGAPGAGQRPAEEGVGDPMRRSGTVSYTHLTLPTICSV